MTDEILVPQVGQDLTEAKLIELNVQVGDEVKKGDIVAVVESEKASFEVESFSDGIVSEIPYQVGDIATVLEPLIKLNAQNGKTSELPKSEATRTNETLDESKKSLELDDNQFESDTSPAKNEIETASKRKRASPVARRIASKLGIDINKIKGTGPKGAVVMRDVEKLDKSSNELQESPAKKIQLLKFLEGDGPPVVCLHGFGSDSSSWRTFVPEFNGKWPLVALDLPCHGKSWEISVESFKELVELVAASIQSLNSDVHLVGHSLGAAVAAALSTERQIEILSMTLISPAGIGIGIDGDFINGFLQSESEASLTKWMSRLVYDQKKLNSTIIEATLKTRDSQEKLEKLVQLANILFEKNTQLFSITDELCEFHGPLTIISGHNDNIVSFREIAEVIPANAAFHRLKDTGHLPQIESFELVLKLIERTIRSAG